MEEEARIKHEERTEKEVSINEEERTKDEKEFQNPSDVALESAEYDEVCVSLARVGFAYADSWSRSSAFVALSTCDTTTI